jgi:ubiquinone/menaquinone biosynthesis C-methylase UbiE
VRHNFAGAIEYARLYEGSGSCAQFFNERLRQVLEVIAPLSGGKVLEVGCGPGILLSRLGSTKLELYGLDCCPEMITEAKERTAGASVRLTVGRVQQLPFEDQSFDVVLALGVLEYLPEVTAGLNEIARVAKPNAVIVVSMLNVLSLYRLWERFIYFPSWRDLRFLRQRKKEVKPLLCLHRRKSLMNMMKACHLEPVDARYYDVNVGVPPFDSEYPQSIKILNRWVAL